MAGFPAKKNTALTFLLPGLTSQADTDIFQVNPTLATGDVKVSTGGASYANIGTLPTALDSGASLSVTLTTGEMNGDYIAIKFTDAAGDEWQDLGIMIFTDTVQMNGIAAAVMASVVENSVTLTSWLRRLGAFAFGKVTDAATTAPKFRDTTDSYNRISPTVDTSGNRSAVSFDDT